MKIIGFTGKAGSGKSTAALALQAYGFKRISIGDAIKEEIFYFLKQVGCEFDPRHLWGVREDKETPLTLDTSLIPDEMITVWQGEMPCDWTRFTTVQFTTRELMQWWGAMRRRQDKDYWIKKTLAKMASALSTGQFRGIVIDDVRLWSEHEMLAERGAKIFRIHRKNRDEDAIGGMDITETELDGIAIPWITNNGDDVLTFQQEVLNETIHKQHRGSRHTVGHLATRYHP